MLRRVFLFLIVAAIVTYLGALAGLFVLQREMVFDTSERDRLANGGEGLVAIPGSTRVDITTPDGETLAGWYRPPADDQRAVFLFLHGKGGGLADKTARWQTIADLGAGVLAFSYRGFAGSTGTPSEDGLAIDAKAAFDWLAEKHSADRIVLHGLSLGTGVATRLAQQVEARALVLEAPYTAIVDVAGERYPWLPVSFLLSDQFRTREIIAGVGEPVLIVHGDRDETIPVAHAEALFALAREPKEFVRVTGGEHHTLVRDGIYRHIADFLSRFDKGLLPQKGAGQ